MKRFFLAVTALFCMLLLITACGKEEPKYHAVSFDSNGAEEYQSRAVENNGLVVEPRVPTRAGYSFLGWYNGDNKWDFDTDRVTSSITLSAKWSRIKFIVKFDSDGGSPVEEQSVSSGDFAAEPTPPTKENKKFSGWYNGDVKWDFETKRVIDFITLKAKWEDYPTYTVTFDSNGGTDVASQYRIEGSVANAPANPTKPDSKFIGWYYGENKWDFASNVINSDITLTARWEDIPTFTVVFDSNGASSVPTQHVAMGEVAKEPPKPDRTQFGELIGWFNGDTKWDFSTPITADVTLVAKWKNIYRVTFRNGSASHSISVEEGETVPKQAEPEPIEGFRFAGWYLGDTEWNFAYNIPTSDITLDAKWIKTFTVIFDSDGGNAVGSMTIDEGGLIPEPDEPYRSSRFRFKHWYISGTDTVWDFETMTVTSDIVLKAKWQPWLPPVSP